MELTRPPISEADQARYMDALKRHHNHPVLLQLDVLTCTVVMGAIQTALRHPAFPATLRHILEQCLTICGEHLAQLDPVLTEGLRWGNNPANDVPMAMTPEERRAALRCTVCGCTEGVPCDGGCRFVRLEPPVCSRCG